MKEKNNMFKNMNKYLAVCLKMFLNKILLDRAFSYTVYNLRNINIFQFNTCKHLINNN